MKLGIFFNNPQMHARYVTGSLGDDPMEHTSLHQGPTCLVYAYTHSIPIDVCFFLTPPPSASWANQDGE